ncbi:MAG: hypothetical protein AB8B71_09065 [Paracoccaceae bacterium]
MDTEKASFYARTDLFVLLTWLIDEADSLVLLEAFAASTAALAALRRCIPDRAISPEHLMEMTRSEDVARLKTIAEAIAADCEGWDTRSQAHTATFFGQARAQGNTFLTALGVAK